MKLQSHRNARAKSLGMLAASGSRAVLAAALASGLNAGIWSVVSAQPPQSVQDQPQAPAPPAGPSPITANPGPATAVPSDVSGLQVQEVVVTAQKRAESLEKVPVSAQVVSGQNLRDQNFNDLASVSQVLPDVHIVNNGSPGNTLNIRGVGSGTGNPAFDQSVATFVDDIYHGRSHDIAESFLDLDHLEVLKGPQSTFFGNNAIAGALNIVTKKPDDHFDGYARVLYGSYGAYAAEAAAGGPVNDILAVRGAVNLNGGDGWIHNVDDDRKLSPVTNNETGRLTFVLKPLSDLDATLKIEGSQDLIRGTTGDSPFQWTNCPPPAPLNAGSPTFYTGAVNKFCGAAIAAKDPLGLHNDDDSGLAGQYARLQLGETALTVNYHRWGQTFTSVTGYYGYNYQADNDQAHVGSSVLQAVYTPETYHQFSQEFRVTSPVHQPIEYIFGAYFQSDGIHELIDGNAAYTDAYVGAPLNVLPAAFAPYEPLQYLVGFGQKEQVESVFGSVSWNIFSNFKLNAGLRQTWDHKHFEGSLDYGTAADVYGGPYNPLPAAIASNPKTYLLGVPGNYPDSRTDRALMPSAGLQYQFTSQSMAYATYTHGFKAGGFNGILSAAGAPGANLGYGPESVNAYEVGVKGRWLDNRLLTNLAVFREDYSDLQVNSLIQLTLANQSIEVKNAASSRAEGVESETQYVLSRNFRLAVDVAYLDAYYTDYPNASPNFLQNQLKVKSQDLSGRPLDFAPKWTGDIRGEYTVDLPRGFRVSANVTPFLESSYYNSNGTDDPLTLIKGHLRLDGTLTLESTSQHWAVDLIGKNLTNAVIPIALNNQFGGKEEPLNVAIQGRYRW